MEIHTDQKSAYGNRIRLTFQQPGCCNSRCFGSVEVPTVWMIFRTLNSQNTIRFLGHPPLTVGARLC